MRQVDDAVSLHRQVLDLVPWVLNETASEEEQRLVEAHVRDCADCREELEFHRQLHAKLSRGDGITGDARPALRRLWARIDADLPPPEKWYRQPAPRWAAATLAAVVALETVGLSATGAALWTRSPATTAAYQTLSAPAAPAPAASIRAVFAPTLPMADLQALLRGLQLQIVNGPGESGAYGLAAAPGVDTTAALMRLRNDAGVRFAEPLTDAAAR